MAERWPPCRVEFREGIVARVRCDEPSSAPLGSRTVSARYYLVAILSSRLLFAHTRRGSSDRAQLQRSGAPILLAATQRWCSGRPASVALVVAAVCMPFAPQGVSLRRCGRGRPGRSRSTLTYWQITSAATPASRSLNASEYGNGSLRSACSRSAEFIGHLSSMHLWWSCRVSMATLESSPTLERTPSGRRYSLCSRLVAG